MKRLGWLAVLSLGVLLPVGCAKEAPRTLKSFHPGQMREYKVVKLEKDEERDLTTVLNIQAKDGWEYNGQITTDGHYLVFQRSTGQAGYSGPTTGKYPATKAAPKPTAPATTPKPTAPKKDAAPSKSPEPASSKIPQEKSSAIPKPPEE
jgi:hypothetical protein